MMLEFKVIFRLFLVFVGLLALATIMTACSSTPEPSVQQVIKVERCPAAPPDLECPPMPDLPHEATIDQLEDAWIDADPVHEACAAAVDAWRGAWDACQTETR